MRGEETTERIAQVLEHVPPVRNLDRIGCAAGCALGIGPCPISADKLDARMRSQPLRERVRRAVRQDIDRTTLVQVNQYRAIGLSFPESEIINAKVLGCWCLLIGGLAHDAEQSIAAGWVIHVCGQARSRSAAKGLSETALPTREAGRAPCPRSTNTGQTFGKNAASTDGSGAEPFARRQMKTHCEIGPGQIGKCPCVAAVHTRGGELTAWANNARLNGGNADGEVATVKVKRQGGHF